MAGDVNAYDSYDFTPVAVNFAIGEATSTYVDLGNWTYLGFYCSTDWASWPTLSFLTATSANGTFCTVYKGNNVEATAYATAMRMITFATEDILKPFRYVQFRIGSTTLGVGTQAAAMTCYALKR